ncbi:hypothetical protein MAUB_58870 [Mycolicibacterium aubagnense]|uniref:DUF1918 domain-containing protein n=1 Tax=Mycolicibacterium aubagnense TaxID=319707 RepID=A0ABN5Z4T4_9MYCO|nr:hypothetical protein MAUB_58870 [Mycolicibacterium aubagnense]
MSDVNVGGQVRVHVRGNEHVAEVVSMSRSRATVRYTDAYGEQRTLRLPLSEIRAA